MPVRARMATPSGGASSRLPEVQEPELGPAEAMDPQAAREGRLGPPFAGLKFSPAERPATRYSLIRPENSVDFRPLIRLNLHPGRRKLWSCAL